MATLWNYIVKGKKRAEEDKIYNPLSVYIGTAMKINTLDLEHLIFRIKDISELKHTIDNKNFYFCDYLIESNTNQGNIEYKLRLVPNGEKWDVILLKKIAECGYDKNFEEGLAFESNNGVFVEGDAEYWRVNDVKNEWHASIINKKGKTNISYWDFWRETVESDVKILEFYYVEKDERTGYFEFWVGPKVSPERIQL